MRLICPFSARTAGRATLPLSTTGEKPALDGSTAGAAGSAAAALGGAQAGAH